jgi:hypothetical protein
MNHSASKATGPRKVVHVPTGPPLGEMRQLAALLGVLEGGEAGPDRWCLWMRSAVEQERLGHGLARFNGLMCFFRFGEGEGLADARSDPPPG